ncbi:MAG: TetM/TetW/TetO/TetS family tetracycline resistance ribosomal protection protein [Prevotella sp.]|nr:TetM/TetW/TetO/TetS family tetracycline resistance ribosomal protection protein [Alistipes senegalensis]MCM1358498.1 TetM/TetW/TetO/TetS family tetracycline resistance ribosomal protection protein [Prevotella sp.]MCM1474287.1 TetM/TetW/TetO/TetS family tetracycline resistance ribosomal protection protein [Muribaculaceae bacterium]
MKKITIGITAHVDSGKTTLSEAMLFRTGTIRTAGRVDNGNSTLDTDSTERERGITIFSHQADFTAGNTHFFLVDTPGHVDFSAETERTLSVLDYAVLVISGTDGVQSHTVTLWKLLEKYDIPVFIFINKTDLTGADLEKVHEDLHKKLSENCTDFSGDDDIIYENSAVCNEKLMEKYLNEGLSDDDIICGISHRNIFPCCHGSALKMHGIEKFLEILDRFTHEPKKNNTQSAKVFKISYDSKGNRLTHMKITGGEIKVRDELEYRNSDGEITTAKISGIRFCTGEKFRTADIAQTGDVCCVTGLTGTYAGQGIGAEKDSGKNFLVPVMTYKANFPYGMNVNDVLKDMRILEDSDPQLHIVMNGQDIMIQLMGAVQTEILSQMILKRFGYKVTFGSGVVTYRETIKNKVEGIGHYEPLRHYAEVHLILEPMPRGSGLVFESSCSEDILDRNWQRLILTHLAEKTHSGVLTGSPVTDIKITLATGKAHLKHTEGGDFRQATYRAVRQGLRSAESVLLEPYYNYELEIPSENTGRAIADLQRMCGDFRPPETMGDMSVIRGTAPVSELNGYQTEVISYTHGKGRLICTAGEYKECHNAEEVIADINYDCDGDIENSADSVFCTHGAGYNVRWNEVPAHMHLPYVLAERSAVQETYRENARHFIRSAVSDDELREIFERTYGKINRDPYRAFKKTKAIQVKHETTKSYNFSGKEYLLVDGYNIIFSWEELKKIAEESLDTARSQLINMMCNYQGFTGYELILVFDAYKVKGKHREIEKYCNINIVYTKESETADTYIEKVSHELSKNNRVRVATSDGLEQIIILGNGAMRISAREFHEQYFSADKAIREYIDNL